MNKTMGHVLWRQYRVYVAWFLAGVLVGVMFADWLRSIVAVLFLAGVVLALYFIWIYFDNLKKQ
ncbi:MAG: hypothetical protein N2318_13230 [Meiothermus sp.]|nr:hypothetical protein [Meiothermus sp.]